MSIPTGDLWVASGRPHYVTFNVQGRYLGPWDDAPYAAVDKGTLDSTMRWAESMTNRSMTLDDTARAYGGMPSSHISYMPEPAKLASYRDLASDAIARETKPARRAALRDMFDGLPYDVHRNFSDPANHAARMQTMAAMANHAAVRGAAEDLAPPPPYIPDEYGYDQLTWADATENQFSGGPPQVPLGAPGSGPLRTPYAPATPARPPPSMPQGAATAGRRPTPGGLATPGLAGFFSPGFGTPGSNQNVPSALVEPDEEPPPIAAPAPRRPGRATAALDALRLDVDPNTHGPQAAGVGPGGRRTRAARGGLAALYNR